LLIMPFVAFPAAAANSASVAKQQQGLKLVAWVNPRYQRALPQEDAVVAATQSQQNAVRPPQ
jgi:hypothetical protein